MDHKIKELYEKGRKLYDKGRYLEAELLLKDVITEYPYYADVLNMLGFMAHMAGAPPLAYESVHSVRDNP